MFKIMNRLRNRKGFTVVELMVTLVLLGLVVTLSWQLFSSIFDKYELVEQRYIIQTEVQNIVSSFQNDAYNYSLYTATTVDMFYENPETVEANKRLESCPELGAFTEDETTHSLTFNNRSADAMSYTYLFCFNGYLYILNSGTKEAVRYFFTDQVPIDIKFTIGTRANAMDGTGKEGDGTKYERDSAGNLVPVTNADGSAQKSDPVFLNKGVTVTVTGYYTDDNGEKDESMYYKLNTSFAFSNINGSINMNSPNGNYLTNKLVAGWCVEDDAGNALSDSVLKTCKGYPSIDACEGKTYSDYQNINKSGNIIRYISMYDFLNGNLNTSGGASDSTVSFNCATRWLMADSDVGAGVVDSLRDFRDEVLSGSKIGDCLIEKYYEYSPDIIEFAQQSPVLKKILQSAVTDFACTFEILKNS